ncbi:M48 family metallopeptidase [Pokkaliibacter sp. CJK22405]|uniref:M48 family metallopeptidase n=1 Tax=Pokkaliibacter sp. CJK22405 TaxID=3384615 RepID=UPI0039849CF6
MKRLFVLLLCLTMAGCATSPMGRKQLKLLSDDDVQKMGLQSFDDLKKEATISKDAKANRYVSCVAQAVVAGIPDQYTQRSWEVTLFQSDEANAFALPGGKIGVYSGLLKVAKGQDQLAAVIGHEVGHVLAGHSNERMSTQLVTDTGLSLVNIATGVTGNSSQLLSLLGVGAQYGVILPFSRVQESEADLIGVDMMARAGFDPRQSISLWENMAREAGASPPELLSTHPAPANRMENLQKRLSVALPLYEQARGLGKHPNCET